MDSQNGKIRAPRNRTITLTSEERELYSTRLMQPGAPMQPEEILNKTIQGDILHVLPLLPPSFVDLLFIDPPYNINKSFNQITFREETPENYAAWFDSWFSGLIRILKPNASVYICGDWRSSIIIQEMAGKYLTVRNRITWEREKGRGSRRNWKNNTEDIWFFTKSDDYTFNIEDVKISRRVIAPYRNQDGSPRDWEENAGGNFRLTHPSNIWTDLTIPFWSMPENTDHPTQKPEKLLARIILASSNPGDVVFDPFAGSGTTSVTAQKLNRNYAGVEIDPYYACLTEKRLHLSREDKKIQGYEGGVFWERNVKPGQEVLNSLMAKRNAESILTPVSSEDAKTGVTPFLSRDSGLLQRPE